MGSISPMIVTFLEDNRNILIEEYGLTEEEITDSIKTIAELCGISYTGE